jgi:membrane-associated phospholipid phosphatase
VVAVVAYTVWLVYFLSLGHFASTLATMDLRTSLDRQIPLVSWMVWVYDFTYVLPIWALLVIRDGHLLNRLLMSVYIATLTATVVYLLVPIAYPSPEFGSSISERFLDWQHRIDFQPGANKMPSLHVANSFMIWLAVRSRGRLISLLFLGMAVLIAISTLLVKKHLLIDIATGAAWAFGAWWLAGKAYERWADSSLPPDRALMKLIGLGGR